MGCRLHLRLALLVGFAGACRVPPPKNVETRKLALGAEVTWRVSNDCGARVLCVKEGASVVDSAVADATDVIEVRQVSGVTFTVRAAKEGVSRVVVQLRDASGTPRTATTWLEVKAMTHSTVNVRCEQGPPARRVYAVAPGATFDFTAQGFAGEDELDTGELPLFEANGFTVHETEPRRATAPMVPGAYPWTLVGGATLDVRVYDAATATVSLKVEAQRSEPRPLLVVELLAGEDPVCLAGAPLPASLSVTSGACFPVVSQVTLRGAVPLELGRTRAAVELEGDGQPCTVSVRLPDGRVTSVTASPPRVGVGTVGTPGGPALDPTGVEVGLAQGGSGVACTDGLSDGRCGHIYDGDCYVDSDWVIEHAAVAVPDAGTLLGERDVVGVGLRTSIRLRVIIDLPLLPDIVVGPPKNLTFRNNHLFVLPGRAAVQDHRCPAPGTDKWHSLSVTPEASGSHHFEFRAENLNDVGTLSFDAYDVTRVTWRLQDADRRLSTASTTEAFVRSTLTPTPGYEGAGGRVLRGEGPLRFSADSADGGSKVTGPAVFTGHVPHVVSVSSPLAGPAATILVRDATAITGVGNFDAQSVKVGAVECAGPFVPLGVMGRPVLGRAPVAPTLEVQGDALRLAATTREGAVCFAGAAPGTASLTVSWGAASLTRTWQVVP